MQKKHIFCLLWVFTGLNLPFFSQAQEIRQNERGEKIIVYPDGRMTYFNGDPIEPTDSLQGTATYPVYKGYIEPLDGMIPVNEADLFRIAQRRAQLSAQASDLATKRVEEARHLVGELQQRIAQQNDLEEKTRLNRQLEAAWRTLQQSEHLLAETQKAAQTDETLVQKGGFVEAYNQRQQLQKRNDSGTRNLRNTANQSYTRFIPMMDNTTAATYEDLLSHPPRQTCEFAFDGMDADKGQYRRDLQPELLFTYTDERLRPYLDGRVHGLQSLPVQHRWIPLPYPRFHLRLPQCTRSLRVHRPQ
ncbi:MAG: hypothetical protein R2795_18130 [Saprospiraceae bacterium]